MKINNILLHNNNELMQIATKSIRNNVINKQFLHAVIHYKTIKIAAEMLTNNNKIKNILKTLQFQKNLMNTT